MVAWGPEAPEDSEAKALARALHATVPVIAGAGLDDAARAALEGAAQQVAGVPAFAAELPELDHAELAGWAGRTRSRASPPSSSTTRTPIRASRTASR